MAAKQAKVEKVLMELSPHEVRILYHALVAERGRRMAASTPDPSGNTFSMRSVIERDAIATLTALVDRASRLGEDEYGFPLPMTHTIDGRCISEGFERDAKPSQ